MKPYENRFNPRLKTYTGNPLRERMNLKPCPFCGQAPELYYYPHLIGLKCNHCEFNIYYHGPESKGIKSKRLGMEAEEELIKKWNRRF